MEQIRKNEIQEIANEVLYKYGIEDFPYKNLQKIIESEGIKYNEQSFPNEKIMGEFLILEEQPCIFINPANQNFGRLNFTKAHELGHYFLKHALLETIICFREDLKDNFNLSSSIREFEKEANYFAICFLMPKNLVIKTFTKLLETYNRTNYNRFFVDNQPQNYLEWKKALKFLYYEYGTSSLAISYRMEELSFAIFDWNKNLRNFIYNFDKII